MIKNYKDLEVWQRARMLVKEIHVITQYFPKEETYGLTQQLRRASISVISNIAEGHSRSGLKDYIHFISMAIGSLAEVETQLIVACDLDYVTEAGIQSSFNSIELLQKKLHALRTSLKAKLIPA